MFPALVHLTITVTLQNGDTGTGKLKTSADTQEEEDEERGSHPCLWSEGQRKQTNSTTKVSNRSRDRRGMGASMNEGEKLKQVDQKKKKMEKLWANHSTRFSAPPL